MCLLVVVGISDDLDMEQTLKNAKRVLALKDGAQLAKQWEVEKAVGVYCVLGRKRPERCL